MSSAEEFIRKHIGEFGIRGTNNIVPDSPDLRPLPAPTFPFTKDNHFRFGFDGVPFNRRPSPSADYWVEYGKPSRRHEGFRAELRRAVSEIYETFGPLSITNLGNSPGRAAIIEARALGIPALEQITIHIEGHRSPPLDAEGPHREHSVEWDDFVSFAKTFARTTVCWDPWFALEAYHGHFSERAHIYSNFRMNLHQHNYDADTKKVIGPPVWGVAEWESGTAINRWMLDTGKRGVAQLLYWSPELIAAQLDSRTWRDRVLQASTSPPKLAPPEVGMNTITLLRDQYPGVELQNAGTARKDPSFNTRMDALGGMLWALVARNAVHYYPLHRLLKHFGVTYEPDADESEEIFGRP